MASVLFDTLSGLTNKLGGLNNNFTYYDRSLSAFYSKLNFGEELPDADQLSYNDIEDHPQIGGVTVIGNKTLHDFNIASLDDLSGIQNAMSALIENPPVVVVNGGGNATGSNATGISASLDQNNALTVALTDSNNVIIASSVVALNIQPAYNENNLLNKSYLQPLVDQIELEGTSVTIGPGKEYKWTLNGNSTLNISGGVVGKVGECRIEITNSSYQLTEGTGLTLKDSVQSGAINYYTIRFSGTDARAYLYDVDSL